MEPRCPHYKLPRLLADPKTDDTCETLAMCELVDKYCLVEYGSECKIYNGYLEELRLEKVKA